MREQKLKKLRIDIDYLLKLAMLLFPCSMYENFVMQIRLSKMWLGKVLGELNQGTSPYPLSSVPESQVIEPEADCWPGPVGFGNMNTMSSIKELRRLIEVLLPEFNIIAGGEPI